MAIARTDVGREWQRNRDGDRNKTMMMAKAYTMHEEYLNNFAGARMQKYCKFMAYFRRGRQQTDCLAAGTKKRGKVRKHNIHSLSLSLWLSLALRQLPRFWQIGWWSGSLNTSLHDLSNRVVSWSMKCTRTCDLCVHICATLLRRQRTSKCSEQIFHI